MHIKKSSWLKHIDFVFTDLICINISFVIAYVLRFIHSGLINPYASNGYRMIISVMMIAHFVIIFFSEHYSGILRRGYFKEFVKVIIHNMVLVGGIFTYMFILQLGESYSRTVLVGFFFINTIVMYLAHIIMKKIYMLRGVNEANKQKILILSTQECIEDTLDKFMTGVDKTFHLVGIALMTEDRAIERIRDIPVVAYGRELYDYACRNVVDSVLISVPLKDMENINAVANKLLEMGITAHIRLNLSISGKVDTVLGRINSLNVVTSSAKTISSGEAFCKRTLDIVAGLVGCLITAVLFIFVAPAIKIADPDGPIFFGQERAGRNGRKFKIYKFRSMYVDAEERKKELMEKNKMNGLMFKIDADPRIIGSGPDGTKKGLGNFLRATSIDEFPNFWSILKGDMSLVGTRPPTIDEYEKYELHHKSRLAAKPGLTGLWQVSGRSEMTDFEEIVKLDNEYIKNWSIGLDIKILLKTVVVVLTRKGSV